MNPWLLLLIAVIIIAIIVVLVSMLMRGDRQEDAEPAEAHETEAVPAGAPAPVSLPRSSPPPTTPSLLSIDRSWDNDWEIRVQGRKIAALSEVQDTAVRKNVMEAIKALVGVARSYAQGEPAEPAKPAPLPTLPSAIVERAQASYISRDVGGGSLLGSIDLAKEIGEIVARLLQSDPILRNHSLQLLNVPGGGIKFIFNGQVFSELDDIPNDGVKDLIRQATSEWNRR